MATPKLNNRQFRKPEFVYTELTADYTLVSSDFDRHGQIFYSNQTSDITITVPDVANVGNRIIFEQYNTGRIKVEMDTGVTGTSFQTNSINSTVVLHKNPLGYRPVGGWDVHTPAVSNPEIFTGNAGAFAPDEVNSVPNVGGSPGEHNPLGVLTTAVAESGHGVGSYALEVESHVSDGGDGSNDRDRFYIPTTANETYVVTYWARQLVGTSGRIRVSTGVQGATYSHYFSHDTWEEYTFEVQADSSTGYFIFEPFAAYSGAVGDKIQFKLSVKVK